MLSLDTAFKTRETSDYNQLASEVEAAAAVPEAQPNDLPPWRMEGARASDLGDGLMLPGSAGYFR